MQYRPSANADLMLRNAQLYGAQTPLDVVLRDGVISEVGPSGTCDASNTEVVDLEGRYVGPGLWDEHVHFTQWVTQRRSLDLSQTASAADVIETVRQRLALWPPAPGTRLTGFGFRDGLWPDRPSLRGLDEIAPTSPVILIAGDLHCAWFNSVAAASLGVEVDASGVLREGPWLALFERLGADDLPSVDDYREAADAAAARGVVGIVDLEFADNISEWPARVAAGVDSLRVEVGVWSDRLDAAIAQGVCTGDVLDPDGLITMGRLKVITDGSLNTRTAWCWSPYAGLDATQPHACGEPSLPFSELRDHLVRARDHGIEATLHAIGDRANTEVINLFAELGMAGRIEHAQFLAVRDFDRMAELGLVASVQPEHAMDDRDVADHYWAGQTDRTFAYASLHRAGVTLRFGSDAPVAPLDPWYAVAAATTRARDDREPWHAEQRLPVEVALAASARGRAGVVIGDPADLVITELDPTTADNEQLRSMPVAGTLVGGRWTWRNV